MAAQNSRTNDEKGADIMNGEEKSSLIKAGSVALCTTEGVLSDVPVGGVRKLGVLSEYEPDRADTSAGSHNPQRHGKYGGSGYALPLRSTDERSTSFSSDVMSPSHQSAAGDDCATILLMCLYCKFYDFLFLLPDTCEKAVNRCCPSYQHFSSSAEPVHSNDCNCNLEFDCGLFDACHETGECLELAMEISEVCYR
ncbi:myoD family inhibitor domain-containing protein 2 [Megalops cyprinoides]|uniref:myoD family inhibitor domain-containing protein 2 n=1 Tax=Megalops cyprinoides TaxID=118141 RepID=UPI001863E51E|nr:myoD family inhibitor domain-containing protein 2 [Megalops cyprinoides]